VLGLGGRWRGIRRIGAGLRERGRGENRHDTRGGHLAPELSRGAISALGWLPYAQASAHIEALLGAERPTLRGIGLAASFAHRRDSGDALIRALSEEDSLLRARHFGARGSLGGAICSLRCAGRFMAEDEECRFVAAWTAALLGDAQAVSVLRSVAKMAVPYNEEAAKMALRRMDLPSAHAWQRELAQSPDSVRLAVIGAGVIGDPTSVPWLIEQMRTPELARVAGEAFTMITGVDIAYEDLEGEWPEGFEAGPTEKSRRRECGDGP